METIPSLNFSETEHPVRFISRNAKHRSELLHRCAVLAPLSVETTVSDVHFNLSRDDLLQSSLTNLRVASRRVSVLEIGITAPCLRF
jgi:hypothetical protein